MDNKLPKIWLLAFAFLISSIAPASAILCGSVGSGEWNDTTIWDCGTVPTANDDVTCNPPDNITIPANYVAYAQTIDFFDENCQLNMMANSELRFKDQANGGIATVMNADFYILGNSSDWATLRSTNHPPASDYWDYTGGDLQTAYFRYVNIYDMDGGARGVWEGLVDWDFVNVDYGGTYTYLNAINTGSRITNTVFNQTSGGSTVEVYMANFAQPDTTIENVTTQGGLMVRDMRDIGIVRNINSADGSFVHYQGKLDNVTFVNLSFPRSLYLGYYSVCRGESFWNETSFANITVRDRTRVGYDYWINMYNSTFSQMSETTWDSISYLTNRTFIVSKQHNQTVNDWRYWSGHYESDVSWIGLSNITYKPDTNSNVSLMQDRLIVDENMFANNINITYNTTLLQNSGVVLSFNDTEDKGFGIIQGNLSIAGTVNSNGSNYWTIDIDDSEDYDFKTGCTLSYGNNIGSEVIDCDGCTATNMLGLWSCSSAPSNVSSANLTTFPYSINIPFYYQTTGAATSCYWSLDGGLTNTSVPCGRTLAKIDADFDGNNTLTFYTENAGGVNATYWSFYVDRNMQGGLIWAVIVLVIGSIAGYILVVAINMGKEHMPLQLFLMGTSFFLGVTTLNAATLGVREYLKTPFTLQTLMMVYTISFWTFFAIFAMVIVYIIYNTLRSIKTDKENQLGGEYV